MSLRGDRIISSIPKDGIGSNGKSNGCSNEKSQCPHSNDANNNKEQGDGNWVYPSPKMFWEAMQRKGTLPEHLMDPDSPKTKEELDWIVTIHNVVNEQCWQEIRKWETFRSNGCAVNRENDTKTRSLKLQRFLGRPDDISPRAWFKSTVLGFRKPFDRHDWYVRGDNEDVSRRYVIDFYSATSKNDANALHLDVRPALDSVESVKLRIRKFICDKFNI